jgi:NAD(P)H-dependent flavin oxidoreductase YrpB (nitropropane dioxygenase family)
MLRTRLTERLKIDHPVLLVGMSSATNVDLVVAVSEAGGLGILGATFLEPVEIQERAKEIRARTGRPFGLNLLLAFASDEQLQACLDARVPVLSTAWGDPTEAARRSRAAGIPLVHMVPTAAQAAAAALAGAAVVVAQGHEGGGHIGSVASLPLVPAAADAVAAAQPDEAQRPPIVAAGGIADGRGLAAALALGADGVLLGTRFLATEEAPVPAAAKAAICAATEADTVCTSVPDLVREPRWLATGAQCRAIRTPAVEAWLGREAELSSLGAPERAEIAGRWSQAAAAGTVEDMVILAGQDCGLIRDVLPAGEIVRLMVAEAEAILQRVARAIG